MTVLMDPGVPLGSDLAGVLDVHVYGIPFRVIDGHGVSLNATS